MCVCVCVCDYFEVVPEPMITQFSQVMAPAAIIIVIDACLSIAQFSNYTIIIIVYIIYAGTHSLSGWYLPPDTETISVIFLFPLMTPTL